MERVPARSEYDAVKRSVIRAAYAAERELDRRAQEAPFGGFEVERWLLLLAQHPELGEDALRAEAERLLVGKYGRWLWHDLEARVPPRCHVDAYTAGVVLMLERMRTGSECPLTFRRATMREIARDIAGRYVLTDEADDASSG
jgi:hypothetical protein